MVFLRTTLIFGFLTILPTATHSFNWQIFFVDVGAKPALDLQPSDEFPHIAYMTEDVPGFVKHGEWNRASFDLSEVATGYFYSPLDLVVITTRATINDIVKVAETPHNSARQAVSNTRTALAK